MESRSTAGSAAATDKNLAGRVTRSKSGELMEDRDGDIPTMDGLGVSEDFGLDHHSESAPPPPVLDYDLESIPESTSVFASNPALETSELYAVVDSIVKRGHRYYAYWSPTYWGALDEQHDAKSHVEGEAIVDSTIENGVVRVTLRPLT